MSRQQGNAKEFWKDTKITALYSQYRPSYPDEIFNKLMERVHKNRQQSQGGELVCADIGCGTGQATIKLAELFDKVYGIEPSQAQLQNATPHDKIQYKCAPAEHTTLPDASVDAIVVAQVRSWWCLKLLV